VRERLEHAPGAIQTADQRLLQQLEIAVVPAGKLGLDLQHGKQIALNRRGPTPRELEEVRIPFMRHDARPGCQVGWKRQVAELVPTEHDDVLTQPGDVMPELGAPEQHGGLQLSTATLNRRDVEIQAGESEGASHDASLQWQRHTVACRASQW
jgi:hypothetical protein